MRNQIIHDPDLARAFRRLAAMGRELSKVDRWLARECPRDLGDHLHAIPTLVICLHGTLRVEGGPRRHHDLAAGEALAIPPATRHRHLPLRGAAQYVDLGWVSSVTDFAIIGDGVNVWGRVPLQPYRGWCERLLRSADAGGRVDLGRRLCAGIGEERVLAMSTPHPALKRMMRALWRLRPRTTAGDILAASGLRPRQAHALFSEYYAETPKQAILTLGLEIARHLLDEGASVGETAARAGFASAADLSRAWRRRFGHPPTRR